MHPGTTHSRYLQRAESPPYNITAADYLLNSPLTNYTTPAYSQLRQFPIQADIIPSPHLAVMLANDDNHARLFG